MGAVAPETNKQNNSQYIFTTLNMVSFKQHKGGFIEQTVLLWDAKLYYFPVKVNDIIHVSKETWISMPFAAFHRCYLMALSYAPKFFLVST